MSTERKETIRKMLEGFQNDLEPNFETIKEWKDLVDEYSFDFLKSLNSRTAYSEKNDRKTIRNMQFDDEPKSMKELVEILEKEYTDSGVNTASGKHFGFIPAGGVFPSALGDYIAAVTNKYCGNSYLCPAAVDIENSIIKWICKIIGFPNGSTGNLCSGSSTGLLYSVHVAREAKNLIAQNYNKAVIYCTKFTHGCVLKALKVGGQKESIIRRIATDSEYTMISSELDKCIKQDLLDGLIPFMVVSTAGCTDVGSVDPLYEISLVANKYNIWHHVDAAYGGFFVLLDSKKEKFIGIELADSVTLDPHKTLFIPYGCGVVIYRTANITRQAFSTDWNSNYLQDMTEVDDISPADVSLELTKHFRGLRVWLPLHLFGLKAYRNCLEEKLLLTEYFYESIRKIGFQVGPKPHLSVTIFRYPNKNGIQQNNKINEQILQFVRNSGVVFLTSTTINGEYWIRCAIISFRSHLDHVEKCLSILKKAFDQVLTPLNSKAG